MRSGLPVATISGFREYFTTTCFKASLIICRMVAPFFGCAFGAWLYDVFLFTGESPINTPGMGLERFTQPKKQVWSNTANDRV